MERAPVEQQEAVAQERHGGNACVGAGHTEGEAPLAAGGGGVRASFPEDEGGTHVSHWHVFRRYYCGSCKAGHLPSMDVGRLFSPLFLLYGMFCRSPIVPGAKMRCCGSW